MKQPKKSRTYVYIDGFNLYYSIRRSGCKWLDLRALAVNTLPADLDIHTIKYFTARVSGATDPDQPRRQQIYLNAITTIPGIKVFFGSFLPKNQMRPLVNVPIAERNIRIGAGMSIPAGNYVVDPLPSDNRAHTLPIGNFRHRKIGDKVDTPLADAVMADTYTMEEKGSDVNLAVHLVNDAWKKRFDVAVVISRDTDLVEPIRIVTKELGKKVCVVSPSDSQVPTPLRNVATFTRIVNRHILKTSVFPDQVKRSNGTIIDKPVEW